MQTFIYADRFFFPTHEKAAGYLPIIDGVFGEYTNEQPKNAVIIDYSGYAIAPGLVDTHIHGYKGNDVMDNSASGLLQLSVDLLETGVTSFLPTTLTASREQLDAVCQTIGQVSQDVTGAKIQGVFLEGPFFSPVFKGAQNENYMTDPDTNALDNWKRLSKGLVNKIAIAPERSGSVPFIKHAKEQDVYVAIAHTDATYQQAKDAVDAGANIFVHTYNAMRGLHHREPGVLGAALTCQHVQDELICDGHHVHPISAKIVMDCNGRENVVLVTDCMAAGGMHDGAYKLGELDVVVKDGTARLTDSGNLAGSILKLYQSVKNVIEWGIAKPYEAYRMASYNAAKSVGIAHKCGSLDKGYPADFIVVDNTYAIVATYLDGVKRFER